MSEKEQKPEEKSQKDRVHELIDAGRFYEVFLMLDELRLKGNNQFNFSRMKAEFTRNGANNIDFVDKLRVLCDSIYAKKDNLPKRAKTRLYLLLAVPVLVFFAFWIYFGAGKTEEKAPKEAFHILVLPFHQLCQDNGKSYDAGFVIAKRLEELALKEKINLRVSYLKDTKSDALNYEDIEKLRLSEQGDMILYGAYNTSNCSASKTDEICFNYITDNKWNLGEVGTNIAQNYMKGGLDELKKGMIPIPATVEHIVLFASLIVQIKGIDKNDYMKKVQKILAKGDKKSIKANVYQELGNKLRDEGVFNEAKKMYARASEVYVNKKDIAGLTLLALNAALLAEKQEDFDMAINFYKHFEDLLNYHKETPFFLEGLSVTYMGLAEMYGKKGNKDSVVLYRIKNNGVALDRYNKEKSIDNWESLANTYSELGIAYREQGDFLLSIDNMEECKKIYCGLYSQYKENYHYEYYCSVCHFYVCAHLLSLGVELKTVQKDIEEGYKTIERIYKAHKQDEKIEKGFVFVQEVKARIDSALAKQNIKH